MLDDKGVRWRFRASNYQSTTRVKPFICRMPMRLDEGWNQIQILRVAVLILLLCLVQREMYALCTILYSGFYLLVLHTVLYSSVLRDAFIDIYTHFSLIRLQDLEMYFLK